VEEERLGGATILEAETGSARGLDQDVVVTEHHDALAAARLLEAGAELREILVGIDDVAFDGLIRRAIVSAVIERDPLSAVLSGSCCIRPALLTATHTLLTSPPRGDLEGNHISKHG